MFSTLVPLVMGVCSVMPFRASTARTERHRVVCSWVLDGALPSGRGTPMAQGRCLVCHRQAIGGEVTSREFGDLTGHDDVGATPPADVVMTRPGKIKSAATISLMRTTITAVCPKPHNADAAFSRSLHTPRK